MPPSLLWALHPALHPTAAGVVSCWWGSGLQPPSAGLLSGMFRVRVPTGVLTENPLAEAFYAFPGLCWVRLPNDGFVESFHETI